MPGVLRLSEAEAIARGFIKPPPGWDPNIATGGRVPKTIIKYRNQQFAKTGMFLVGWLVGFACAILFF